MQHDVSASSTTGESSTYTNRGAEPTFGRMQPLDYVFDAVGSATDGVINTAGFVVQQTRTRPLVAGSLIVGILGAIVGTRIAQMQAMRRRRNFYQRAIDNFGELTPIVAGLFMRRAGGPTQIARQRGREILGAGRGLGSSVVQGMPTVPSFQVRRPAGRESFVQQMGYALSLIPITIAFVRNPLVRRFGFRLLSRRVRGR